MSLRFQKGVRYRPTDEKFIPYPGKPTDGFWRDGRSNPCGESEQDEVRTMGHKLWAQFIVSLRR